MSKISSEIGKPNRTNQPLEAVPPRGAGSLRTLRALARLGACCVAVALLWACGPVYIPVPPPAQTTFTQDPQTPGFWIAAGGPEPRASNGTYYVFDQQRNAGVIAGAMPDGSYQAAPMAGTAGDHVLVNYKDTGGKLSATACLILSEQRPSAALCP